MRAAADVTAAAAKDELQRCKERVDVAHAAVALLADREEIDKLTARIANYERHQRELDAVRRELATISVTAESVTILEKAAAAVERAAAAVEQTSARIEVAAAVDVDVAIDGTSVPLTAGQTWTTSVSGVTGIDVPGVLSVRVIAGATAASTQAALDRAEEMLAAALREVGRLISRRRGRSAHAGRSCWRVASRSPPCWRRSPPTTRWRSCAPDWPRCRRGCPPTGASSTRA